LTRRADRLPAQTARIPRPICGVIRYRCDSVAAGILERAEHTERPGRRPRRDNGQIYAKQPKSIRTRSRDDTT
jgi:hypothetical protein